MTSDRNRLNSPTDQAGADEPVLLDQEHPFAEFARWLEAQLVALELRYADQMTARSVARAARSDRHSRFKSR
ncbi:MAG: hypothetical protein K1X74_15245 [Pirellulales bacterium]|nr:hypothetical protein [Pirellulales bacterium]